MALESPYKLPIRHNWTFFSLALNVEALQGKMCQDSLLSGEGRSLGAKISGGRGHPWGIFFDFYKTRHILLSDSANCIVLHAVVLIQYWHVRADRRTDRWTDGQTDRWTNGIAVPSTALAMRHAVKMNLWHFEADLFSGQFASSRQPVSQNDIWNYCYPGFRRMIQPTCRPYHI